MALGIDGVDPRLTKYHLEQGYMPNLAKFLKRGSAREDLVLLGGMPTIAPPMWTTLATGAYPMTHGITDFWRQNPEKLDTFGYALDSRLCHAEQLWNVFAEAGKKTLVWHWPGSSWPPSSDSENLYVVDGTNPDGGGALSVEDYREFLVNISKQNDYYLGRFLHLLDEGWTLFLVSDHGLITPEHGLQAIGGGGVDSTYMREWGFTEVLYDADGNPLPDID